MRLTTALLSSVAVLLAAANARAGTLEDIRGRGVVTCAVPAEAPGLSETTAGKRKGLAVDLCAMLAAATLGRSDAVAFVETGPDEAAVVLQAGEADVLFVPRPWQFAQEVSEGLFLVEPLLTRARDGAVFGPSVRQGDDSWFVAVRWCLAALRSDAGERSKATASGTGSELGLAPDWVEKIFAISDGYDSLLASHMKAAETDGWAALPTPSGMKF